MNFFKRTIPTASILLALSLASVPSNAKPETERIPLWPEPAYASDGITKTDNAYITYFLSDQPNASAAIICPGGGYRNLESIHKALRASYWNTDYPYPILTDPYSMLKRRFARFERTHGNGASTRPR